MRSIVHLSDLHFGRTDATLLPALGASIRALAPDVVVVSGDLTQRARAREFEEARRFLAALPAPQIVVPGNHDVPLYNLAARWLTPLDNFRRFITNDLEPFYADREIAIQGLNTARSLTLKNGRINRAQALRACARLTNVGADTVRIVVTHHPFARPELGTHGIVGRASMAMTAFAQCRVDVILSGHLHLSHTTESADHFRDVPHSTLLIQAGTATSSRRRHEVNSFNLLRVEREAIAVERFGWDESGAAFKTNATEWFRAMQGGWARVEEP